MESTQYLPDLSSINAWLVGSGCLLLLATILAIRFLRPVKSSDHSKFRQLYFLLSAFTGLLALTIFAFMLFNRMNNGPVVVHSDSIEIQGERIPMKDIRSTKVHRAGNGIPFQGIGVDSGTKNSLIIEYGDSQAKLLSEDFYPIDKIAKRIKALKTQKK